MIASHLESIKSEFHGSTLLLCKLMMLSKHLHLCFFKLKCPSSITLSQPSPPSSTTTTTNSNKIYFSTNPSNSLDDDDYDYDDDLPPPPTDFASVCASQRFFFSYPGTSNSIIDSSHTNDNNNHNNNTFMIPRGGVKVPKYSLDPYNDFLSSMHEMVDSRQVSLDVRKDWDYLHQLLLCYLHLNPPHTHKFIVRAFTDLVVDLLSSSSSSSSLSS